jgi:uncharacterized repeat protein (TIGR01451 family)
MNGNTIWQLTDAGIYIRDENTVKVLDHFYITDTNERYTDIKKDKFNNIWVGLDKGGIAKFDGKDWTIWDIHNTAIFRKEQGIQRIGVEADGTVWVLEHSGSSRDTQRILTFKNNIWSRGTDADLINKYWYPEFVTGPNDEFLFIGVDTILVRKDNQWVGVPEYIEKRSRYYSDPVFDSKGNFWLWTSDGSIYKYHSFTEKPSLITKVSMKSGSMILDKNDNPWITTGDFEISVWKNNNWTNIPNFTNSTIQGRPLKFLKGNDNRMYVQQTFYYYQEMVVTKFEDEQAVSNHYIEYTLSKELGMDGIGNLWFGGDANVLVRKNIVDGSFDYFEFFQYPVSEFQWDDKNIISGNGEEIFYILISGKIIHFDGSSWTELKRNGSSWKAIDAAVSKDNKLYIVTEPSPNNWYNDLYVYNLVDNSFDKVDLSLFGNLDVQNVEMGSNNVIWFVSDESLGKINPDGTIDLYGLPNNFRTTYEATFYINQSGMVLIPVEDNRGIGVRSVLLFNSINESWTTIEIPKEFLAKLDRDNSLNGPFAFLDSKDQIWLFCLNNTNITPANLVIWNYSGNIWNEVWCQPIGHLERLSGYLESKDGKIVLLGPNEFITIDPGTLLSGLTINDVIQNCSADTSDQMFPNLGLAFTDEVGKKRMYISNQMGRYSIYHPSGKVHVKAIQPNPFWESCNPTGVDLFLKKDTSATLDILMDQIYSCPFVDVQVTATILRACREAELYIKVANNGTESTDSATVTITLPAEFNFLSSNLAYADLGNQSLKFFVGHLDVFQKREFMIHVMVSCNAVVGQDICLDVRSYPNEICNADPFWSGADVRLSASCKKDHVEFELWNKGKSATTSPLKYSIYKNDNFLKEREYALAQGEKLYLNISSDGSTYRLISNQEKNHPAEKEGLSLAVEDCNHGPGSENHGYLNSRANFTGSFNDLVFCFPVIASRDPNDKTASPAGVGENTHYITREQELEYTIRFQNTGNDTAFDVRILDTLDRNLDIEKFQLLQSSHPVQAEINNNLLSFKFSNIYLPDSSINNSASNGFVKYRISPKENAPFGSYITNKADIYFDFNEPVLTNDVWHIINPDTHGTGTTEEKKNKSRSQLIVYPNPTNSIITIDTKQFNDFTLRVFDLNGRLLELESIHGNKETVELSLQQYSNGLYFISLLNNTGERFYGKVFKQ